MEQGGEIDLKEARRWKEGFYGLMSLWGLEADELLSPARCPITRDRDISRNE